MSGHENCTEGIYHYLNSEQLNKDVSQVSDVCSVSKEQAAELLKDKVIVDLVDTLKRYAGFSEREINGRPRSCQGYGWDDKGRFCFMDNVGHIEDGGGPELALMKLREYNLID